MDFTSFLSSGFFYFCPVLDYRKWGIWRFNRNGTISGLQSRFESTWRLEESKLKIFDKDGQITCAFDAIEKAENRTTLLRQGMETTEVALIPAEIDRYDIFEVPSADNDLIGACIETGSTVNEKLREFILQDKTLDGYDNGRIYIIPRKKLKIGLNNYKGVYYQSEKPKNTDHFFNSKLLVWFQALNSYNDGCARTNFFPHPFWGMRDSLAKNTVILRIADSNLINGSYYFNTTNFPNYENCIQELIRKVAAENQVPHENIICAGSSRGGTGALYHGVLGGYSVVAMNPVVNRSPWLEEGDVQLMFDQVRTSFVDPINHLLEKTMLSKSQIQIISSPDVPVTSPYIMQLNREKFQLNLFHMNLVNSPIKYQPFGESMHRDFVNHNVPLTLYKINELLYGFDRQYDSFTIKSG